MAESISGLPGLFAVGDAEGCRLRRKSHALSPIANASVTPRPRTNRTANQRFVPDLLLGSAITGGGRWDRQKLFAHIHLMVSRQLAGS